MVKRTLKVALAIALSGSVTATANAFTIDFETGSHYQPVETYSFGEQQVAFSNAAYNDTYATTDAGGNAVCYPNYCATSGRMAIAQYLGQDIPALPINAYFNFDASSVSIWAINWVGNIESTLTAYDSNNEVVGMDSFLGLPPDLNSTYPYSELLTVTGSGIRSIKIAGSYWDGSLGYKSIFDDLTVIPTSVPEPETYAMMLVGLGLVGFMARRRKQIEA